MEYKTIVDRNKSEIIEKKSKFIAQTFYISSKEEADKIIKNIKKEYYDARHNCFAYSIYNVKENKVENKSSDDGEPSGTAGVPILSVINGNNLINVLIVVTRYFGGILLGTGGLVRAYKEATEKVIENSKKYKFIMGYEVEIFLDYDKFEKFKYFCKTKSINITNIEYAENIKCIFEIKKENYNESNDYYSTKDIVRQKPIISEI